MGRLFDDAELELVRRFYDFDLDEKEMESFQKRMEEDEAFAEEVEHFGAAYLMTDKLLSDNPDDLPPPDLDKITLPKPPPPASGGAKKRNGWLLPALIGFALLCAAVWYFTKDAGPDPDAIYADVSSYSDVMINDVLRGEEDTTTTVPPEAARLQAIIQGDEAGKVKALEGYVKSVTDPVYSEPAHWALTEAYLKNKDLEKAKSLLEKIIANPDFNSANKAKKILDMF